MLLQYLLEDIEDIKVIGETNFKINEIQYDSKKIKEGDIFVAIKGFKDDGTKYIDDAIENGAKCIVCEDKIDRKEGITYIFVKDARKILAIISSKYYNNAHKKLKLIGITGTKGKTTTAYMIRNILLEANKKVGMIGTINITYGDVSIDSTRTSPESLDLHKIFNDMVEAEIEYVVMEVSSHALELDRVYGLNFDIGVFTNLGKEHLDFHKTMEDYLKSKSKLFEISKYGLINGDDMYRNNLFKLISCKTSTYGLDNKVNLTGCDVKVNSTYTEFKLYVNKALETIVVPIPGRFTVYNALAAVGVCSMLNIQMDSVIAGLSKSKVPGRNEVVDVNKIFSVIVDYAHNPSSLQAILENTKRYVKGRIICVFGCGGDRDKEKRSIMGEISGNLANFTIVTTDNPRSENPKKISNDIIKGINTVKGMYKYVENRKEAIKFAMRIAWKNDVILICGKGHEDYQILKSRKIHFDDREVALELASKLENKNLE